MDKKCERKSQDTSEEAEEENDEEEEEEEQEEQEDEDIDGYTNAVVTNESQDEEICTYCDEDAGIDKEFESPKDPVEYKMRKKRALLKFKTLVEDAICKNYLVDKPKKLLSCRKSKRNAKEQQQLREDISLWGVPLLPSRDHEGTEIVLLKFLKANNYKVRSAFYMLRKVMKWRKEYGTDSILDEDLLTRDNDELKDVVHTGSTDKQGRPLYYTVYGAFKDKALCTKVLGTEESRENFLRLKVQNLEKSIKQLSFKSGGVDSIVQITDLKNFPAPMKELSSISKKIVTLFQSNYPGIINKNILINVPFWYYTSRVVTKKLMNPRARKKFILARPSNVTQTLSKYISIEQVPAQYGGLKRDNDVEFSSENKALEHRIRANAVGHVNIPVNESGVMIVWDYTIVGWDVSFKEQFIPDDEGSYTILIRAGKVKRPTENARNSYYISEPGKIVITVESSSYARKKVYYRFKTKPISAEQFFLGADTETTS